MRKVYGDWARTMANGIKEEMGSRTRGRETGRERESEVEREWGCRLHDNNEVHPHFALWL